MKLLPCPFCGFDLPNVVQLNDPTQCEDGSQAIAGEEAYAVHCDGCGVWASGTHLRSSWRRVGSARPDGKLVEIPVSEAAWRDP